MRQSHYNELMKIAADLETEGDDDIAKSLRYAIANPSFNGAELQSDRDSWRALAESAKRDLAALAPTAEQAEGVRVDTGPNLEGLRERLLTPREIVRTSDGFLYHPDYPTCDEGTRADKFLEAFGIETRFVGAESDSPDFAERWIEEGLTDCSEWIPTPPEGEGWLLLEIYDTEDGPYAMFGRDWYAAERARKRANMLRLGEELRRRRAAAPASSAGEQ
jgi:hypothetical protein